MATFESAELGIRVFQWVSNLRRNLRQNAEAYKTRLARGDTVAVVQGIADADAGQYLQTIGGLDLFVSDPAKRAKLLDGLSAFGILQADAVAELSSLRTAAEGQRDANKNTEAQITAMSNALLAYLPAYEYPRRLAP